ncbi:CHLOROPLAST IMPORT APPARATUS 2-like protein [Drosera capensis]
MRNKSREISTLDHETVTRSTKKSSYAMKRAARRTRNKIKKPKFLSLRLQLSNHHEVITQPAAATTTTPESITSCSTSQKKNVTDHQFPSLPERDTAEHESMEIYFGMADGGSTSLMALLNADTTSEEEENLSVVVTAASREESEKKESDCSLLLQTALRSREREASIASEEKWVCISEVVEQKEEEVCSCEAEQERRWKPRGGRQRGGGGAAPVLKLDYEEVINAWCDKGPLFVEAESTPSSRAVPDFYDDFLFRDLNSKEGQLWVVPENSLGVPIEGEKGEGREGFSKWHREASLLRYKEKRQSRLFSKRIRYEVRKLNAEKRPRVKGRFVKRNEVKCSAKKHL